MPDPRSGQGQCARTPDPCTTLQQDIIFINFEGLSVRSAEDVERIRSIVAGRLRPLGRKVYAIVNYDNFSVAPEL